MSLVVRAFPLRTSEKVLDAFAAELCGERAEEASAFYRRYGISHESWHLQRLDGGWWVIGVTKVDDADEASQNYAAASQEFEAWFKTRVKELSGVDPDSEPLGPPTRQVFAWSDGERPGSDLCA